jgi:phosphoribosylformylglycinamidine (FGAM) synthase-like enzyme
MARVSSLSVESDNHRPFGLANELGFVFCQRRREPNLVGFVIFSIMWSKHCSSQSSCIHLPHLFWVSPQTIAWPSDEERVVTRTDTILIAGRVENHNHPRVIESTEGVATSTGAILRSSFVGVLETSRLVQAVATDAGDQIVFGIAAFDPTRTHNSSGLVWGDSDLTSSTKRRFGQSDDPEPRVIQACLRLLTGIPNVGIGNLRGAGITSATFATSVHVNDSIGALIERDPEMTRLEISRLGPQEHMFTMVMATHLSPESAMFDDQEVQATVIYEVLPSHENGEDDGHPAGRAYVGDELIVVFPAASLTGEAQVHDRPQHKFAAIESKVTRYVLAPAMQRTISVVHQVLGIDPSSIQRGYDHMVLGAPWVTPDTDATVRVIHARNVGAADLIMTPPFGGAQLLPRADLTLGTLVALVGADPIPMVACLNFSTPEHLNLVWLYSLATARIAEISNTGGVPFIGAHANFHPKPYGSAEIDATLVVLIIGLRLLRSRPSPGSGRAHGTVILVTAGDMVAPTWSMFAFVINDNRGAPPPVKLERFTHLLTTVVELLADAELVNASDNFADEELPECIVQPLPPTAKAVAAHPLEFITVTPGCKSPQRHHVATTRRTSLLEGLNQASYKALRLGELESDAFYYEHWLTTPVVRTTKIGAR